MAPRSGGPTEQLPYQRCRQQCRGVRLSSSSECEGVEDVVSVLTLVRRGAAQVCHVLRVEELREQLEVEEEEEGKEDGQEEEEEVESREGRVKERQPCG